MSTSPLADPSALMFSHVGFYVRDIERMSQYYQQVLGFKVTDTGKLGPVDLVFLSRLPAEHHQLVLASGRPPEAVGQINQLSFRVGSLAVLRHVKTVADAQPGTTDMQPVTHGNAISIYFRDPEGNRIEVFMDTPWYCEQPLREPLDINATDEEVMQQALALAKDRPRFQPREQWLQGMEKLMGGGG